MICEVREPQAVSGLFDGWQDTLILSCLQKVMGRLYADSAQAPTVAMAMLGDFCFLTGTPNRELAAFKPEDCRRDFMIMVPQNDVWAALIESCYGQRATRVTRYAFKKEPDAFDRKHLRRIVDTLPHGFTLKMMDEELFQQCQNLSWCADWVSQYPDFDLYRVRGLGAVILKDGQIVSGASSYSGFLEGIEIQIDTREDYRQQGLAAVCGAKLILECLDRGWYPSWDAQNRISAALAEKLGYHFECAYTAYEIREY